MNLINKIELPTSSKSKPLSSNIVLTWLNENWGNYLALVDNNDCSNKKLPCFCCERNVDCLFVDIYTKLSVIEEFNTLNNLSKIELEKYNQIKSDINGVKNWLKNNLELGHKLITFSYELDKSNVIRRSFINGKNKITNEFDYLYIFISIENFSHCYKLRKIFEMQFYDKKILPLELENYIAEQKLLTT